jgi:hypothetical protein
MVSVLFGQKNKSVYLLLENDGSVMAKPRGNGQNIVQMFIIFLGLNSNANNGRLISKKIIATPMVFSLPQSLDINLYTVHVYLKREKRGARSIMDLTVDTDTSKSGNGRPLDPTSLYQVQYSP